MRVNVSGREMLVEKISISILALYYSTARKIFMRAKSRRMNARLDSLGRQFHVRMWCEAARSVNAHYIAEADGAIDIERDRRRVRVRDNLTSLNDPRMVRRADDKAGTLSMLKRSGIPVPKGIVISLRGIEDAVRMLETAESPLVVKPAGSTCGGAGVSTNVTDLKRLRAAMAWARSFGRQILVERQVEGDCYRVLVMDGEVLDTVVRHPPTIVGDGVSTIRQLIRRENADRVLAASVRPQVPIHFDFDLQNTLASQRLSLNARPAIGETVQIKRVINENGERENVSVNGLLCPAILNMACKASRVLGLRLAGVDIICKDPNVPLEISGGAVIEVNASPGLYCHYNRQADLAFPVAERVLHRALRKATEPLSAN